jgi:tRNA (guanine37-N1)-methyltransferase
MKQFNVLTLFPNIINSYFQESIIGKAITAEKISIRTFNIRDQATDKHKVVDDTPYGGGPGMIMKIEPIDRTLKEVSKLIPRPNQHIIVLSARGKIFNQSKAQQLAQSSKTLTLICGRYEGIDQRVADHLADEELSVGPYVLAGGELAALIVTEAIARLVPGVLGNPASLNHESFTNSNITSNADPSNIEYPQYTKPEIYHGWSVPKVLLSGNHELIKNWRASPR